ncbi:MAG TPA: hypothetical protein VGP90_13085 [Acidimicrobiia bacterium]|nr:hypothetical protein [Acidimicrobiia bacterium]
MPLSALLARGKGSAARLCRRPPLGVLVGLAGLGCLTGLAAAPGPSGALPLGAIEVRAQGAPSFGLIPTSRRDEAVLQAQPEIQTLGVGTTLARAKLARLQGERIRRLAGATGRRRLGLAGDAPSGRPSGAAAPRLRAPPSPD